MTPEERKAWETMRDLANEKLKEAAKPREPIPWERMLKYVGECVSDEARAIAAVLRVVEEKVEPFLDSLSGVTYIPHKIPSFVNTEESRVVGSWRFVLAALDKARTPEV